MNIEMIQETIETEKLMYSEKKKVMVDGELIVPDIKPDILNLISVYANCFVTSKETVDNRVRLKGIVDYFVIYLADDEKNTVRGMTHSIDFTEYFDVNGVSDTATIITKCQVGSVEARVVNNRKINIKSVIEIDLNVFQRHQYCMTKDVSNSEGIEIKRGTLYGNNLIQTQTENITLNEKVELGESQKPISVILKTSIQIIIQDYKTSYNKILAKAEALISIVYVADDEIGSLQCFETRVPVMGFVDVDSFEDGMSVLLDYEVKSLEIKPIYQDLKANSISVSSEIELSAKIYKPLEVEIIEDLYGTEQQIKPHFEDVELIQNNLHYSTEVEISQNLLIPELDVIRILDIEANPMLSNINVLEEKLALEGTIFFHILYYRNDKSVLESKNMELPFQQVVKIPDLKSGITPKVEFRIAELSYKATGQNQLQIDVSFAVLVEQDKTYHVSSVNQIEQVEDEETNMPSLVVYFVKEGDSLWNIAKKFKTTVESIIKANDLNDDVIYPGQQIIIPKRKNVVETMSLL